MHKQLSLWQAACVSAGSVLITTTPVSAADRLRTYANPIDLPYRYQAIVKPHREAADPTIVLFHGRYWLFASHSKGYWWSDDLLRWTFIEASGFDLERYAPTVVDIRDRLFLMVSQKGNKVWSTDDPITGQWHEVADIPGYDDPALFLDDDRRLYLYEGISPTAPLRALELDPTTFRPLAKVDIPQSRDPAARGFEVPGDHDEMIGTPPYIEGAWMAKHDGRYYLEYSAPGTQYRTYGNGLLVADKPMGPFVFQTYSPFAFKPSGFIAGTGHGNTFSDARGRWWHSGTMTLSRRFLFERRLGLFPAEFTARGELFTDTYLGDYPRFIDGDRRLTGWMLLSRSKLTTGSSTLEGHPLEKAADEDVQTWWSARTGNPGEWFAMDLGATKRIDAVQINFADQDSSGAGISHDVYKYRLRISEDGQHWRTVVDHSTAGRDAPHDYEVFAHSERARYLRLENVHSPDGGKFSLYDLRVFGLGRGSEPARVTTGTAKRDSADPRHAIFDWHPAANADFYIVRIGTRPDLLIQNYQVYDNVTSLSVRSLNAGQHYYFAVDTVNEKGVTRGHVIGEMRP